jgi:hypothetical protein
MTPFEIGLCQEALQNYWGLKDSFEKYPEEAIKELSQLTGIREKYIKENLNEILA